MESRLNIRHVCTCACMTGELCKGVADGLYPVAGHCRRYTECTGGSSRSLRCPTQTYFNPVKSACTLVDKSGAMPGCAAARS